jgi:hypothetical protein
MAKTFVVLIKDRRDRIELRATNHKSSQGLLSFFDEDGDVVAEFPSSAIEGIIDSAAIASAIPSDHAANEALALG